MEYLVTMTTHVPAGTAEKPSPTSGRAKPRTRASSPRKDTCSALAAAARAW